MGNYYFITKKKNTLLNFILRGRRKKGKAPGRSSNVSLAAINFPYMMTHMNYSLNNNHSGYFNITVLGLYILRHVNWCTLLSGFPLLFFKSFNNSVQMFCYLWWYFFLSSFDHWQNPITRELLICGLHRLSGKLQIAEIQVTFRACINSQLESWYLYWIL